MALTLRTNGSSGVNLVTASWWNDYYNLLTGVMQDQIVTLKTEAIIQTLLSGTIAAPSAAAVAGTALGVGVYQYLVTFYDNNGGETMAGWSATASVTTTTNNQAVSLTGIPTGPVGTVGRRYYRTKVGGSTFFFLTHLANNTGTTYTDTITDANLGASGPPSHSTFGGALSLVDNGGNVSLQLYGDGYQQINQPGVTGQNADMLAISRTGAGGTANILKFGVDASGFLYCYDANATTYLFYAGANATLGIGALDGGTGTHRNIRIFIGTVDPATYTTVNEGDIWINA